MEKTDKPKKGIVKPLHQILDEMEKTIKTAAESAIKAEEVAKEARKAADMAIRASKDKSTGIRGYLVIFERTRNNYSAYSPDIPGCIATGKTRKETEKNIKESISFHLEGLKEDGLKLPEPLSFAEYIEIKAV